MGTMYSNLPMMMNPNILDAISMHHAGLPRRPDWDGFVTIKEGIAWAKAHPGALQNPTPDNMLYINSAKLNFGNLYTSDFEGVNTAEAQNLFSKNNLLAAVGNSNIRATAYALGRVNMILHSQETREVSIVNDFNLPRNRATDYDCNRGGSGMRPFFINAERIRAGLNDTHGFRAFHYGTGRLNRMYEPQFTNVPQAWKY